MESRVARVARQIGGWARDGTQVRRWVVIGIMRLWAQSDGMLSRGDERNMYGVPKVVPKRKFADRHGTDGEQACLAGLSAKIDDNAAFGDVQHVTSGLEEGRAQHGHSSSAHSTPRNQCRDAGVVAGWLFVHQLAERWIKGHWGWCACWDMWI